MEFKEKIWNFSYKPGKFYFVWKNTQNNYRKGNKKYGFQEKIWNFSNKCINKMKHFMILFYVMNLNEIFFLLKMK